MTLSGLTKPQTAPLLRRKTLALSSTARDGDRR